MSCAVCVCASVIKQDFVWLLGKCNSTKSIWKCNYRTACSLVRIYNSLTMPR